MARRKREPDHENHERWLVSYADFMTLLFAFFVMLYANSNMNKAMAQQISESFRQAMAEGRLTQALSKLLGAEGAAKPALTARRVVERPPTAVTTVELLPSLQLLNKQLEKEIHAGRLEVRLDRRGLVISLREAAFFPPGNDAIEPGALPTLTTIAAELNRTPNPIRLEGHTDSVPISTERFPTNWHLSSSRAVSMLELFSSRFGIPAERMAVAGFADTAPVATNQTPEGRARNRRVDIVVLNEEAVIAEPSRAPHGTASP
ncbi:MAG TPA: flagellar motor protein MotB [Bryobacteraceae bacterium]|nr:flagellar motor protein MotB [Bryobacteraceae bacterium]